MKRAILTAASLLISAAWCGDNAPKAISELHATKMELLVAREQLARQALESIASQQRAMYVEICKAAGIEGAEFKDVAAACSVDLEKRTVSRIEKPAAK